MERVTKEKKESAGPEAAARLREMFVRWERGEAARGNEGEPSWDEVKIALNAGRPEGGEPFPESPEK